MVYTTIDIPRDRLRELDRIEMTQGDNLDEEKKIN